MTTPDKLSGMLNYAIEGLHRLFDNKKFSYSKTTREVEDVWKKSSDSILAFMLSHLKPDPENKVLTTDLWNTYMKFCMECKVDAETIEMFWNRWNRYIKKYFPDAVKKQFGSGNAPTSDSKGKYYWQGIKLIE